MGEINVAGLKTFGTFPETPSSAPTTDYQVANKKYVDDNGGNKISITYTDATSPADTNENTIFTQSIAANTLGTVDGIRLKAHVSALDMTGNGTFILKFKYGSTTVVTLTLASSTITAGKGEIEMYLLATGATNSQEASARIFAVENGVANNLITASYSDVGTATEDSTGALNLVITAQSQNTGTLSGQITLSNIVVTKIN